MSRAMKCTYLALIAKTCERGAVVNVARQMLKTTLNVAMIASREDIEVTTHSTVIEETSSSDTRVVVK